VYVSVYIYIYIYNVCVCMYVKGRQWCSWLRHCATSWKVAGLIPSGGTRIFH